MNNTTPETQQKKSIMSKLTVTSKSILARLLASENIIVEHQANAPTAYFDTRSRRLVLPVWDTIDEDVYDMFVSHEVSHALHTPPGKECIDRAVALIDPKRPKLVMNYLNIVEDARIERMIKEKFPGLTNTFYRAYRKLYNDDVFGIKSRLASGEKLPLIDKLNLRAKVGIHAKVDIHLNSMEETLYLKMLAAKEFGDVVRITHEIYKFAREQAEEEKPEQTNGKGKGKSKGPAGNPGNQGGGKSGGSGRSSPGSGGGSGRSSPGSGGGKNSNTNSSDLDANGEQLDQSTEAGDSEEDPSQTGAGGGDQGDQGEDDSEQGGGNEEGEEETEESDSSSGNSASEQAKEAEQEDTAPQDSITSKAVEKVMEDEAKKGSKSGAIEYIDIPKSFDATPYIENYDQFITNMAKCCYPESYLDKLYDAFQQDSKNYVNYLVKEFELRKAADMHARTDESVRGILNPSKLHQYKFSEDIFKRMSTVRAGKSHGMVMVIDWSGSMLDCMAGTIKQLMNLVAFCRRIQVPYEVYAFSDSGARVSPPKPVKGSVNFQHCRLINLLSSRASQADHQKASKYLMAIANYYAGFKMFDPKGEAPKGAKMNYAREYELGGTPLDTSILYLYDVVPKFQERTGVQIVNAIVLTDGEDSGRTIGGIGYNRIVIRDLQTRTQVALPENTSRRDGTSTLITLLKNRTGCNAVGFYLLNSCHGRNMIEALMNTTDRALIDATVSNFRNQKFAEITTAGYDNYFIIPSDELDTKLQEKDDFIDKALTGGRLKNAFIKAQMAKRLNRVVLNRFTQTIATKREDRPKKKS